MLKYVADENIEHLDPNSLEAWFEEGGWHSCEGCTLHEDRFSDPVFASGPRTAQIMIVGEAPGATEEKEGEPFVGDSGELLEEILNIFSMSLNDFYVTNAVMCRPIDREKSKGKDRIHRTPSNPEINACKPRLLEEIYHVDPKLILCLGASAAKAVLGGSESIERIRGDIRTAAIPSRIDKGGPLRYSVMVSWHPAKVLRDLPDKDYPQILNMRQLMESDMSYFQLARDIVLACTAVQYANSLHDKVEIEQAVREVAAHL